MKTANYKFVDKENGNEWEKTFFHVKMLKLEQHTNLGKESFNFQHLSNIPRLINVGDNNYNVMIYLLCVPVVPQFNS